MTLRRRRKDNRPRKPADVVSSARRAAANKRWSKMDAAARKLATEAARAAMQRKRERGV